jgi:hypothetical protein
MLDGMGAQGRPPGLPGRPCFHFSVDDVFAAFFADPREAGKDGDILRFLIALGADFGAVSDLYLFHEAEAKGARHSLDDLPSDRRAWLAEQDCLRFGPHAFDYETRPYEQSPAEQEQTFGALLASIDRFARPEQRSPLLRLHFFSECIELAPWFRARGVRGLFLTDKPAVTYRLDKAHRARLIRDGWTDADGFAFLTSHLRFERRLADGATHEAVIAEALVAVRRHGFVSLFTHEVDLRNPELRAMISACIAGLVEAGVRPAVNA